MRGSLIYSTLPDQRDRLETTTDMLTYALVLGLLGVLFGPFLSSISDRFDGVKVHFYLYKLSATEYLHMIYMQVYMYTTFPPGFKATRTSTSVSCSVFTESSSQLNQSYFSCGPMLYWRCWKIYC